MQDFEMMRECLQMLNEAKSTGVSKDDFNRLIYEMIVNQKRVTMDQWRYFTDTGLECKRRDVGFNLHNPKHEDNRKVAQKYISYQESGRNLDYNKVVVPKQNSKEYKRFLKQFCEKFKLTEDEVDIDMFIKYLKMMLVDSPKIDSGKKYDKFQEYAKEIEVIPYEVIVIDYFWYPEYVIYQDEDGYYTADSEYAKSPDIHSFTLSVQGMLEFDYYSFLFGDLYQEPDDESVYKCFDTKSMPYDTETYGEAKDKRPTSDGKAYVDPDDDINIDSTDTRPSVFNKKEFQFVYGIDKEGNPHMFYDGFDYNEALKSKGAALEQFGPRTHHHYKIKHVRCRDPKINKTLRDDLGDNWWNNVELKVVTTSDIDDIQRRYTKSRRESGKYNKRAEKFAADLEVAKELGRQAQEKQKQMGILGNLSKYY